MPVVRDGGGCGRALLVVFVVGVGRLTSALVRPALELAVAVARAGRQEVPPVEPPARLRPVLGFARLPAAALDVVRRTLDEDVSFRARVASSSSSSSSEEALGRAAWLFLHRPEGWEDELAALDAAASSSASVVAEARAERSTARRLEASEAAARRSAGEVVRLQAELARATSALAEERRARRAAEDELASLQRRVSSLERERDAAHRRASAADAQLEALRSPSPPPPPVPVPAAPTAPPSPAAADVRLPVVLPRGLLEDAPEAADFLVRVADAVLVVDGYNASLRRWPDEPIAEQRRRLLDALGALSARSGLSVHVVFDGTGDVRRSGASSGPRLGVQVTFTADEVEADDVILDLVDALPRRRPVIVASDDRRVRRGAAARGANLLTQAQLLRVVGAFGG